MSAGSPTASERGARSASGAFAGAFWCAKSSELACPASMHARREHDLPSDRHWSRHFRSDRRFGHDVAMALPEDGPLPDIHKFFAQRGLRVIVHENPPREPVIPGGVTPHAVDRALRPQQGVVHPLGRSAAHRLVRVTRWYGAGVSEEDAVRRARARWRVEQERGPHPGPRHLP
jgi:hypothetical protein